MIESLDRPPKHKRSRRRLAIAACLGITAIVALGASAWIGIKAKTIQNELQGVVGLVPTLKANLTSNQAEEAAATTARMREGTAAARSAASDPLWTMASGIPLLGANFSAASEVARTSDDVVHLGLEPLVKTFSTLNWDTVLPSATGADLDPLIQAAPSASNAAYAVRSSAERLEAIDAGRLIPQIAEPLSTAREQLRSISGALEASADAANLLPDMMGAKTQRNYLLMIQNNAETRASGGIPGALAILTLDQGKLSLSAQSSAGDIGVMSPPLPVDAEQQQIYSGRLGKFMQDVNLTPDFPTAANTAKAMWERKTGQKVDGIVSIDPVVLSYILAATGPVQISSPELISVARGSLPTKLDSGNVVQTLLSDVYEKIEEPQVQDAYFAGIAEEVFSVLSSGKGDAKGVVSALVRGTEEGRVLLWSAQPGEQKAIAKYPLSGSVTGESVPAARFGVYFNDGTGAKMDYYAKRTVRVIKECPKDGYEQVTVRITSTNTAPVDAATSLPAYVTGAGLYGVPAGSLQTNIVAYGPVQANVETAKLDGDKTPFAPHLHDGRPVAVLSIQLAPGETKVVDFTFGKIVQHTEPDLAVTPTVQPVKDVKIGTENAVCG